ncbi:MAG: PLP-dependent aminotransferase family protein [Bacillati bacterium ANGP1]|uniref:PLP-dependent aminotransferase family protein n=1 Tax=Candidatus Segetimicrobium genomatis TaxID=2569760 RepID=A0A537K3A6_9BACT|nr:MAG: PLP-dependent aminotransferase family protein [Terrabacteria group bacterium ANGP1]
MQIALDRSSEIPLYRQLHAGIAGRIRAGDLTPGAQLPSVRNLAKTLRVSQITVVQAYNALAAEGLIGASAGRGTFVRAIADEGGPDPALRRTNDSPGGSESRDDWQSSMPVYLRAPRIGAMQSLLRPGRRPGTISLAGGTPDPGLFPLRALGRLWSRVMALEDPRFLQYGTPQGDFHLRSWIAERSASMGITARPEDVLVTSGSQQAIDLIARTFVGPGDYVLVESPTFITALDILEGRGAKLLSVPLEAEGPRVDQIASLIERYRPRLMYTIPTGHNPTGITMAEERRRHLASLARRHNLLILEDDSCSEFAYDADAPPAIKAFDQGGHVALVVSFSKTVIPGLRVGCVIAHGPLMARLAESKSLGDRFTSPLIQRTLWRYLSAPQYTRDLVAARETYRRRRDALLRTLKEVMPSGVKWTHPAAGFNLWIHLPDGIRAAEAFEEGLKEGVACALGDLFLPHEPPPAGLRISFADNPEDVAAEGVRRLARAIARLLSRGDRGEREGEFVTTV